MGALVVVLPFVLVMLVLDCWALGCQPPQLPPPKELPPELPPPKPPLPPILLPLQRPTLSAIDERAAVRFADCAWAVSGDALAAAGEASEALSRSTDVHAAVRPSRRIAAIFGKLTVIVCIATSTVASRFGKWPVHLSNPKLGRKNGHSPEVRGPALEILGTSSSMLA